MNRGKAEIAAPVDSGQQRDKSAVDDLAIDTDS